MQCRHGALLSLFSGAGGLDLGFEQAGYDIPVALDLDPVAVETHNFNRNRAAPAAQLCDLAATPSAIVKLWQEKAAVYGRPVGIIGGPPCQAFSISNVHKVDNDPRGQLANSYARIVGAMTRMFNPDFFVFENVGGLSHRSHRYPLESFLAEANLVGFDVRVFFLDAISFGVPQFRRRLFIVGFNRDRFQATTFMPPVGDDRKLTVRDVIGDLPEPIFFSRRPPSKECWSHPNHWCMNPRSKRFSNGTLISGKAGRSLRTLKWDRPSWTVAYGHREVHVHPNGRRRLSVYESMLLQGMPNYYELKGTLSDQIRLISDAVPPPLAKELAAAIANYLGANRLRWAAK